MFTSLCIDYISSNVGEVFMWTQLVSRECFLVVLSISVHKHLNGGATDHLLRPLFSWQTTEQLIYMNLLICFSCQNKYLKSDLTMLTRQSSQPAMKIVFFLTTSSDPTKYKYRLMTKAALWDYHSTLILKMNDPKKRWLGRLTSFFPNRAKFKTLKCQTQCSLTLVSQSHQPKCERKIEGTKRSRIIYII